MKGKDETEMLEKESAKNRGKRGMFREEAGQEEIGKTRNGGEKEERVEEKKEKGGNRKNEAL